MMETITGLLVYALLITGGLSMALSFVFIERDMVSVVLMLGGNLLAFASLVLAIIRLFLYA